MEYNLVPKPRVAGSSPVFRSTLTISTEVAYFQYFAIFSLGRKIKKTPIIKLRKSGVYCICGRIFSVKFELKQRFWP